MNLFRTLTVATLAISLSSCALTQPGPPTLRTTYNRGDLEIAFQAVRPGPAKALKVDDKVRVELRYKNLTGKPFLIWAMPSTTSGGYPKGGCYEPSGIITEKEGILERFITACQTPNEAVTEIRIQAVASDQSITFYEGVISNVNYSFSN